ncbi:NADPH-dependent glutamate synthase beta chain [Methylomagnum ishizawai]|uniref:NADPH-dependent glutamate synthase beta chain n=1 Tax=Methylomagnum ishizawai TaxID=1760988 RepID=A0A1Y6CZV1_9GAMM|nr:pyridine nucleotide-disulfide oxidoreductase [Methylomagnum ishizawai]SMF95846.1 NADPH-dependent glutamate synthase beta chain [Methylomagnum ishizawai]
MTDSPSTHLTLGLPGYTYADLYDPARLAALSADFDAQVQAGQPELFAEFAQYRASHGAGMKPEQISDLLVRMAPEVGGFVARLFGVEAERAAQIAAIRADFDGVFAYKNDIVGKVASRYKGVDPATWDAAELRQQFTTLLAVAVEDSPLKADREAAVAGLAVALKHASAGADTGLAATLRGRLLAHDSAPALFENLLSQDDAGLAAGLYDVVCRWTFAATRLPEFQAEVSGWLSFKSPAKSDFAHLVHHATREIDGYSIWSGPEEHHRRRDGFGLTDPRFGQRRTLYEVDHCIYCHDRDTDSCSKGMRNKKDGSYKSNPLGVTITGCPLEEKISEMHAVKREGDNIGSLALITIDNPLCPGTGHRICNDCMKGCIYQKTEPVNIPQIETNVLTDVLFMPWGFEIYSLLTRWNPLNLKRPHALAYNGKNVLVAGMGPAGYTLSHYLLNEGFGVVGIDGLKIEPLPKALTGDAHTPPQPIRDFRDLYEALDKRIMLGFGGVAEYGITVRWDKNFLKVIYLNLLRRHNFRIYGGVRFGGTLTINEAWDLGFDHIAIASGAGKPTVIDLKNNLIRGIRKASDFLMGLQLTGAAKESSLANMQVRLPAGVIGGGLTAIDTCTEALAYYPVQVEKVLHRYEKLCYIHGEAAVRARYDAEETAILDEFLEHGRIIQAERQRAEAAGEKPHFLPFLEAWGGVTMFYRKGIEDAPAYRQNAEEIKEALDEGIRLAPGMNPLEALEDPYGHLRAVKFERLELQDGKWRKAEELEVPLRSLFVAAGTSPNTIYESEHPDSFEMDKKFYQRYQPNWESLGAKDGDFEWEPMHDQTMPKLGKPAPFTSYRRQGRFITFYGDNHPVYAGNVVKAMASAKDGYPYIAKLYEKELAALDASRQAERDQKLKAFQHSLDDKLLAHIVEINRITPTIIEVIVRAPLAAKHFCPGQFYRVQNFEAYAPVVEGTTLLAEGLALTGAWVDKEQGLVSLIALEMGSSSRLLAQWKPGDPVIVMGVTGAPTEIHAGQTVALLGGGLGNAVLFSIGKALRAAGSQVVYFAGYRKREDVFKIQEIEAASDVVVWSVDKLPGAEPIQPLRPQDKTFVGNIVEAMVAYAEGQLGPTPVHLDDVDHLIVIGSDRMMAAVKAARFGILKPYLKPHHSAIGSINSPMQCMMKGVCAQCLCKHVDPETGKEYFVYSCYNQDQELDRVDFPNLNARLRQNSVQEKLSGLWLEYLLSKR